MFALAKLCIGGVVALEFAAELLVVPSAPPVLELVLEAEPCLK